MKQVDYKKQFMKTFNNKQEIREWLNTKEDDEPPINFYYRGVHIKFNKDIELWLELPKHNLNSFSFKIDLNTQIDCYRIPYYLFPSDDVDKGSEFYEYSNAYEYWLHLFILGFSIEIKLVLGKKKK